MTEGQLEALFLLAGLVAGGGWGAFGERPSAAAALLIFAAACAWLAPGEERRAFAGETGRAAPPERPWEELAVGAAACAPAAVFLALTWRQEWPFSGDQPYQLSAHRTALEAWTWLGPRFLALAAALWFCARRGWLRWGIPAAFLLLWRWNYPLDLPYSFARYPGLGYLAALPVDAAARSLFPENPLAGPRLANVLWIPAWLFGLRPLLLRRRPSPALLASCLFLFWQKDVAWTFASAYLEPGCVALCLLAFERVLEPDPEKALDASLLIGAAALVKEQAALFLPFVWLAARPWRLPPDGRPRALRLGLVAVLPFAFHVLLRGAKGVWRVAGSGAAADVLAPGRAAELASRLRFELGVPGLVAAAAVLLAALWTLRRSPARAAVGWLLAGAAFQIVFFYADKISVAWTGYPRFNLFVWTALAGVLIELGRLARGGDRSARRVYAVAAAAAALNALVLIPFEARAARLPDPYRSFTLHYDDPMFFDIAALERSARERGALDGVTTLVLADRVGGYSASSWFDGYPALRRRYRLGTQKTTPPGGPPDCRCRAADAALLVPFRLAVNLSALRPAFSIPAELTPPPDDDSEKEACAASLRAACARVVEDRRGPDLLGVMGVGLKTAR